MDNPGEKPPMDPNRKMQIMASLMRQQPVAPPMLNPPAAPAGGMPQQAAASVQADPRAGGMPPGLQNPAQAPMGAMPKGARMRGAMPQMTQAAPPSAPVLPGRTDPRMM